MPEVHQRMSLYKRVSQVRDAAEVEALAGEIRDRYGALPPRRGRPAALRGACAAGEALGVQQADLAAGALHLRLGARRRCGPRRWCARCAACPARRCPPRASCACPCLPAAPPLAALAEILCPAGRRSRGGPRARP